MPPAFDFQDKAVKARKLAEANVVSPISARRGSSERVTTSSFIDGAPGAGHGAVALASNISEGVKGATIAGPCTEHGSGARAPLTMNQRKGLHLPGNSGSSRTAHPFAFTPSTAQLPSAPMTNVFPVGSIIDATPRNRISADFPGQEDMDVQPVGITTTMPMPAPRLAAPQPDATSSTSRELQAGSVGEARSADLFSAASGGQVSAMNSPCGTSTGLHKTPPQDLLDEIANSLRDTSRHPSFAKIQSVQVVPPASASPGMHSSDGLSSGVIMMWVAA